MGPKTVCEASLTTCGWELSVYLAVVPTRLLGSGLGLNYFRSTPGLGLLVAFGIGGGGQWDGRLKTGRDC